MITASPEFTKPQRTPPFLTSLVPPPYLVQAVQSNPGTGTYPSQSIELTVVSEDLQSGRLQLLAILDFPGFRFPVPNDGVLADTTIKPGHLGEVREPSRISITFPRGIEPGCHTVTVLVSHRFSYNIFTQLLSVGEGSEGSEGSDAGDAGVAPAVNDLGTATWFYALDGRCDAPVVDAGVGPDDGSVQ
ncbi:MAG TPA: hypothetical protein VJT73_16035 [Polyangiaceae bacterium]|nr:hypothetical protein [Polyangiaceae bacterium]